jgi:hypothetical protein
MVASRASLSAAYCISEPGVAEGVARAIDRLAGSRAPQVPRLPADACEKDRRHGNQQQFSIELHGVFLRGPWPLHASPRVVSLSFEQAGTVSARGSHGTHRAVRVHPTLLDSVHV